MPRGQPGTGSGATKTATSGASTARSPTDIQIWQGASLDGQTIFRLTKSGTNVWQLHYMPLSSSGALSFRAVAAPTMYVEALAALGSQYAGLMFGATSLANRSVPRTQSNAIPINGVQGNRTGTATRKRVRNRVKRAPDTANA